MRLLQRRAQYLCVVHICYTVERNSIFAFWLFQSAACVQICLLFLLSAVYFAFDGRTNVLMVHTISFAVIPTFKVYVPGIFYSENQPYLANEKLLTTHCLILTRFHHSLMHLTISDEILMFVSSLQQMRIGISSHPTSLSPLSGECSRFQCG